MFKGPRDVLRALRSDLRLIDSPAPHILVDLLAVELSDEANRKLGLDWTYAEGHFGFFQPSGNAIQTFPHVGTGEDYRVGFPSGALDSLATLPGVGQSFYQGVGTLPREFFIRLNTLVSDGDGTILANPRTVAMSGKESMIQIRKTLNYFFNEGFDVSGRPIVKKSDISADTEGRIIPTLLDNGTIHLVIDVKVGSFTFTKDAGLPELTTRQSTTEVTVEQGQTLILGGLRQQEVSSVVTKVPVLGNLPILGPLFRHEETDVKHTVLTIFITPQILSEENPLPEWPSLDPDEYRMVPIMDDDKVLGGNGYHEDEE
jgi:general secretion pathway protein D